MLQSLKKQLRFISIFAIGLMLSLSALAEVDVLIVSDMGGHESTAAGVEQLLKARGFTFLRINNQIFKMPYRGQFWDRVRAFDDNPEKLNKDSDAYEAIQNQAETLAEIDRWGSNPWMPKRLISLLESVRPKLVIFVTPWGISNFSSAIHSHYIENLPIAYVPTDYGSKNIFSKLIPKEVDMTFAPSPEWAQISLNHGVPASKLTTTGIPVNPNAMKELAPEQVQKLYVELNVNPNQPVIFLSGGSAGIGKYPEMVASLDKAATQPIQVMVGLGNRPDAAQRGSELKKLSTTNVKIVTVPFRDDLPQIWRYIADVVVTKAGGLTTTELTLMGKPAIYLIPAVAGERQNAEYFVSRGMGLSSTIENLGATAEKFFRNPSVGAQIKTKLKAFTLNYKLDEIGNWTQHTLESSRLNAKTPVYHHQGIDVTPWEKIFNNYIPFDDVSLDQEKTIILRLSRDVDTEWGLREVATLIAKLNRESVSKDFIMEVLSGLRSAKSSAFLKGAGIEAKDVITRLLQSGYFSFMNELYDYAPEEVVKFAADFAPEHAISYYTRFSDRILKNNSHFIREALASLQANDYKWLKYLSKETIFREIMGGRRTTFENLNPEVKTEIKSLLGDIFAIASSLVKFEGNTQIVSLPKTIECNTIFSGSETTWVNDLEDKLFGKKRLSITFDDGPSIETTPKILDVLKRHGVKATFFQLGENVARYPDLTRRVMEEGHVVASHTLNHPDLTQLSSEDALDQILKGHGEISKVVGDNASSLFRFPYGGYNRGLVELLREHNLTAMGWNIDSMDWNGSINHNADELIAYTMKKVRALNRGILLMHDTQAITAETLDRLLTQLKAEGYSFIQLR